MTTSSIGSSFGIDEINSENSIIIKERKRKETAVEEFKKMIDRHYIDDTEILVLSKRQNPMLINSEVIWNYEYNEEYSEWESDNLELKEKKRRLEVKDKGMKERSNKQSFIAKEEKRIRDEQNAVNLMLANRFSILDSKISNLNIKFSDNLVVEDCVDKFVEFKPVSKITKPSKFTFDKILKEHKELILELKRKESAMKIEDPLLKNEEMDIFTIKIKVRQLIESSKKNLTDLCGVDFKNKVSDAGYLSTLIWLLGDGFDFLEKSFFKKFNSIIK